MAVFLAMLGGMWANRYSRVALQTTYLVGNTFVDLPTNPYEWSTADPMKVTIEYGPTTGTPVGQADLYSPSSGGPHGAVLVVLGAAPEALDDPRLVRLARGVARIGVVVMVPRLDQLLSDRLVPQEIDEIALAFASLQRVEGVDPTRVGIVGFSAGAGLALVAATDPTIRNEVALLVSFGGYYDLFDLIAAITTRTISDGRSTQVWQPAAKSVRVLRRSLISYAEDPAERELLTATFAFQQPADPTAVEALSPLARTVYDLLDNTDPEKVEEILAAAPEDLLATLRRLSPSAYIDDLRTDVYILHDRNDKFVPYLESRRLAEGLSAINRASYIELDIFRHVNPRVPANPLYFLVDLLKFFFQLYRLELQLA